jgi:hypothetical protein
MRKNNRFEDGLDAEQSFQMDLGLSSKYQKEIMQKVSFTDRLLTK